MNQWTDEDRGQYIGYLPQDVSLLDGTIAQNICRFDPEPEGAEIIEAAKAAGVHELIVRLPEGNQSFELIESGSAFSEAGQVRVRYEYFDDEEHTIIEGNTDDDDEIEFEIGLDKYHELNEDYFIGVS